MEHVQSVAVLAMTKLSKSIEMCQAFLLLSVYSRLTDGWPEDRSWLYLGISIR
jgi:hypothetical protein